MSKNKIKNVKPVIENRQARFNFDLSENFEAGISLNGWEVKAIRAGQADMKDSYVLMKKGEAWLIGMNIQPLNEVTQIVDPNRTRKLLLTKSELSKYAGLKYGDTDPLIEDIQKILGKLVSNITNKIEQCFRARCFRPWR